MKAIVRIEIENGRMAFSWDNLSPEQLITTLETAKLQVLNRLSGPAPAPTPGPDAPTAAVTRTRTAIGLARNVA